MEYFFPSFIHTASPTANILNQSGAYVTVSGTIETRKYPPKWIVYTRFVLGGNTFCGFGQC